MGEYRFAEIAGVGIGGCVMKRLAWLLIAVLGTALAQVQPVELATAAAESCCCTGDQAGACGMPDCAPAPTAPTCVRSLPVAEVLRSESSRPTPAPRAQAGHFPVRPDPRPAQPAVRVFPRETPVASVPLFAAHCRYLI